MSIEQRIYVFNSNDKESQESPDPKNLGYWPSSFQAGIFGPVNSGKSSLVFNLLLQHASKGIPFKNLVLCHYKGDTTEYNRFGDGLRVISQIPHHINEFWGDDIECDEIECDESEDEENPIIRTPTDKTLIVLDDCHLDRSLHKKQKEVVSRLMGCISSHSNGRISVVFTSQELISVDPGFRRLCRIVTLFRYEDTDTLYNISRKFGIKRWQLEYIFDNICNLPHDCLTLCYDMKPKARKNLFEAIDLDSIPKPARK